MNAHGWNTANAARMRSTAVLNTDQVAQALGATGINT